MLLWLVVIAIEVWANWYKIEIKGVSPKHWLWFIPRLALGALFAWIFKGYGYEYIWSICYLVGTHGFLYAEGLNRSRRKPWGYLGDPNLKNKDKSLFDKILLWISDSDAFKMTWLSTRFIIAIFVIGNMIIQGKCTWYALNHGGC